jgi:benzylsuccinate synthase
MEGIMTTESKDSTREAYWWEAENTRSPRLNYLRKAIWSKNCVQSDHLPGVMCGLDRVYWSTKVFSETEGEPMVFRRAMALNALFEHQPVFIVDQSQIVGYSCARPNEVVLQPESNDAALWDWYYDGRGYIYDKDKEWYASAIEYWSKNCFRAKIDRYLTEEEKMNATLNCAWINSVYSQGYSSPQTQWDFVHEKGFDSIKGMIDQNYQTVWDRIHNGPAFSETLDVKERIPADPSPRERERRPETLQELLRKLDQWNAMKMTLDGFKTWTGRYSRLAKIIVENFEEDPKREAELLKISEICAKVGGDRPEHFHEAIQLNHFVMLATRMMERHAMGYGFRIDQLWWPAYKRDVIDEKTLTREEARELLGEFQIRTHETCYGIQRIVRQGSTGAIATLPVPTIGGVDERGRDACNDLTDDLLEALRLVRCSMPSYMFRWHPKARMQTLKQVHETIKQGLGYPSIQHDGVCIDTLMEHFDATLEEARSWANVVCMSPSTTKGSKGGQGVRYTPDFISTTPLVFALHNGYHPIFGMQWGPKTGDPREFTTFEEVWEAWKTQMRYYADMACRVRNIVRCGEIEYFQTPFTACGFERCVRDGKDSADVGELSNAWCTVYVWMDVPESLIAMKKLVFDDKKYTMDQLLDAMNNNWEGQEQMRLDFAKAPKWGNDDDYADDVVAAAYKELADAFGRNIELDGWPFMGLPENAAASIAAGPYTPALPNGRRLGDPCYDGGASPGPGLDKKGPTAVLRSCSKVDWRRNTKEALLNQRLSNTQMAGEKGFQLWLNYMKTWYDLDVPHVQFNCVDTETLRAAQHEPEKYEELIVRVAGYSAHFVDLARIAQDAIVARTLQEV